MSITADQNTLDIALHRHLEIGNPTQPRPRPKIQSDPKETKIITSETAHLLALGVIEPAVHTPDEFISSTGIVVRKKKCGQYPMILNLKGLNKQIEKHHFKIDTFWSAARLMTPNCLMAPIDPKDAFIQFQLLKNTANILDFTGRVVSTYKHVCQMDFVGPLGFLLSYWIQCTPPWDWKVTWILITYTICAFRVKTPMNHVLNISDTQCFQVWGLWLMQRNHTTTANYILRLCPWLCVNDDYPHRWEKAQ